MPSASATLESMDEKFCDEDGESYAVRCSAIVQG